MSLHYVGEVLSGGMVFHTYHISSTEEECFIMSLNNLSISQPWSNVTNFLGNTLSMWDGRYNTLEIINQSGHTDSAALVCNNYDDGNWYLPSISEMRMISQKFWELNYHLSNIIGAEELLHDKYWTSNDESWKSAFYFDFTTNSIQNLRKDISFLSVRAIKKVPC